MSDDLGEILDSVRGEGPSVHFVDALRQRLIDETDAAHRHADVPVTEIETEPMREQGMTNARTFVLGLMAAAIVVVAGFAVIGDRSDPDGDVIAAEQAPDSTSADTASSAGDLIGEWASVDGSTIWVVSEDTITATFDGQQVISEYTATGTTLEFGNESGPMACPSFQPGTYEWAIEGDVLSLTLINDDCGRAIALNGAVFERR